MRTFLAVPLLAACATCASPDPAIVYLDRTLAGYSSGESQECIPANRGQKLVIQDRSTVVARRGETLWVNRLAEDCPGFEPPASLIVEVHGSQYCRGDRVRGLPMGHRVTGPFCVLGDFTPYTRSAEPPVRMRSG